MSFLSVANKIPIGKKGLIKQCNHADIRSGTVGLITDYFPLYNGFAVEVLGEFQIAGANISRVKSTETVFVETKNLVVLN